MRTLKLAAVLVASALASTSAPAQVTVHNETGQTTMTQERAAHRGDKNLIWNMIGCLGLIGLTGLWRSSDNDGYTDDPI